MIQHGTQPVRPDHRNFSLNRTFGAVAQLPDSYLVDAGFGFPDQNADGLPYGCTGYAQSELCQDEDAAHYSPSYTYLKTRLMEGTAGQNVGCSITDSLKSTIVYGVQEPTENTDLQAGTHRRAQYFQVEAVGTDMFTAIQQALILNEGEKRSVSCGTPWMREWETAPNGILHDFVFTGNEPWHNWKICGWKQINGQPYLIGKSWQGTSYGDGGWHYLSRDLCNKVFALSGTAAFTVRKATAADVQTVKLTIFSTILSYLRMWAVSLFSQPATTAPQAQNATPAPITTPTLQTMPPAPNPTPQSPTAPDLLTTFCEAIRDYEGSPGDLNYQNNNPGNCRCSPVGYAAEYGNVLCVETASGKFAKFPTYALGWLYLKNLVDGRIKANPSWTFFDFFRVYSPRADSNDPSAYAEFVAKRCDLPATARLIAFINTPPVAGNDNEVQSAA
jgi:hypothetical protein